MARPNILRADTLDLQDQDNPTAAEHAKHPQATPTGNAPHVAAQVTHVLEERQEEEQALADAWNIADNLTDEPSAIDEAQANHDDGHVTNGVQNGGAEGTNAAETEAETEDDMMDRISSSPSIEDGGYPSHAPQQAQVVRFWPRRSTSLSPAPNPTRESFNQTVDTPQDSSPFVNTPQHLPLKARMVEVERSPSAWRTDGSSSPFDAVPREPLSDPAPSRGTFLRASKHHHRTGRYYGPEGHRRPERANSDKDETDNRSSSLAGECSPSIELCDAVADHAELSDEQDDRRPIESPFRTHLFTRSLADVAHSQLQPSPSPSSINSVDLDSLLLPVDDPLLDGPLSPNGSIRSWDSLSDHLTNPSGSEEEDPEADQEEDDDDDDDDDDADDAFLDLEDRFIDSGWGGECLRETEDIDFEFVYALHTFVATVEGQANATKGDTMVLLDDSNSYWWLVRVVKDSSIGYLPAEHIETPTERLARLNKHRNIDLSATMLSDNSEKSRNPLKKAMRRRNAKTVQFAAPTYVEASDYDYSTEDEEHMIDPYGTALQTAESTSQEEPETTREEPKAEVKDTQAEGRSSTSSQRASFDREQAATAAQALAAAGINGDDGPVSPKLLDKTEAAPLKSKKRSNTDSFLGDGSLETRKITLTPGLLREESASAKSSSETTQKSSFESLTKSISPPEQPKKDIKEKKKEPKKGGMLSGLFKSKKKDKKTKDDLTEAEAEKVSSESPRASPLTSGKSSPVERRPNGQQSSGVKPSVQVVPSVAEVLESPSEPSTNGFVAELQGSEVAYEMPASSEGDNNTQQRVDTEAAYQEKGKSSNPLSPITNMLKPADGHDKPKKAKRSKQRVELDDFDSPQEELATNPFSDAAEHEKGDSLTESPVEISGKHAFMHGTDSIHIPMPGDGDEENEDEEGEEEEEDDDEDEPGSLTSSPSIIEHPAEPLEAEVGQTLDDNDPTPTAPRSPQPDDDSTTKTPVPPARGLSTDSNTTTSTSRLSASLSQQAWNDESLRAWLEDGSEVRDMLVMIHDKTGVTPAAPDHPLMSGLFVEQRKGVQDMMGQLDGLLGSYLQRKGVKF